jgi:hypothetical protein
MKKTGHEKSRDTVPLKSVYGLLCCRSLDNEGINFDLILDCYESDNKGGEQQYAKQNIMQNT